MPRWLIGGVMVLDRSKKDRNVKGNKFQIKKIAQSVG
jgi:hypothetical protein